MTHPMTVTFRRAGRGCAWTARRPPRTIVPGPTMAAGAHLPHDLATFVVERELGITDGFWGCVAAGATFRTLGRKRTPQGIAVIRAHLDGLDDAERRVNATVSDWLAGRDGGATAALDEMLARWRSLVDGEQLTVDWPYGRPGRDPVGRQVTRRRGR